MNLLKQLEAEQMAKLTAGKEIPEFQPGDTVLVNVKIIEGERSRVQAYEGVCIGRAGAGINENFTVRKISYGEGVERVFPLYSPMIDSIKVVRKAKCAAPSSITCAACAVSPHALSSGWTMSRQRKPAAGSTRLRSNSRFRRFAPHKDGGYSSATVLKSAGSTISSTSQSSE